MSERSKGFLYIILAQIGWGTVFIACKLCQDAFHNFTLVFIRYFVATILLLILYRKAPKPVIKKKDWKFIAIVGVGGYFLSIVLQMVGVSFIDASLAFIIHALNPVMILVFAMLLLRERCSVPMIVGICIAVAGAVVIIGGAGSGSTLLGIIISAVSMMMWALTSVVIRKTCANIDAIWLTIIATIIAMVCDIPFMIGEIAIVGINPAACTPVAIIAALWIGVVCSAGSNLWWSKGLQLLPASTCSMSYPIMPLTTAVIGVIFLHEPLSLNLVIGGLLILAGLMLAVMAENRKNGQKPEEKS